MLTNSMNNELYEEAKESIDKLVKEFFELFTVKEGEKADLSHIYDLFIPEGLIIKNVGSNLEIYSLQKFIEPREKMFNEKILTNFKEKEVWESTSIFGNVAQRLCVYEKSGYNKGVYFEGRGMKSSQFIKTPSGWKIASCAWDDEGESLNIQNAVISSKSYSE